LATYLGLKIVSFRVSLISLVILLSFTPAAFAATGDTEGAYEIGAAAYKAGQFQKARQYFESASIKHPADPNVHYGLAETYIALGRPADGLKEYAKTIKLGPKSKLAEYARTGQQYASQAVEQATMAKMAKLAQNSSLPVPSQPQYFGPQAWPQPGSPTMITSSSGGYGSSIGMGAPLPQPTYPSYGPQPQPSYPMMSFGRGGRWGNGGYGGYGYSRSYYYRTPQLQVRSYGYAPPLNIIVKQDPPPPVELLARQERLVLDEKNK
jgi:tetratricopeptide (TPR) repeat protein